MDSCISLTEEWIHIVCEYLGLTQKMMLRSTETLSIPFFECRYLFTLFFGFSISSSAPPFLPLCIPADISETEAKTLGSVILWQFLVQFRSTLIGNQLDSRWRCSWWFIVHKLPITPCQASTGPCFKIHEYSCNSSHLMLRMCFLSCSAFAGNQIIDN